MPRCNLCGEQTEKLFKTNIEGAELIVCSNCARLGEIIAEVIPKETMLNNQKIIGTNKLEKEAEVEERHYNNDYEEMSMKNFVETVIDDYGRRVKNAREKKGLMQKDFAKMLAIKESLLHNIESGHFEPSLELAKNLEKKLHIKLIEQIEDKPVNITHGESASLTLGDMIKKKLKK